MYNKADMMQMAAQGTFVLEVGEICHLLMKGNFIAICANTSTVGHPNQWKVVTVLKPNAEKLQERYGCHDTNTNSRNV